MKLSDIFKKTDPNEVNIPQTIDENAEIRVIGDRGSGKTAYMASLAYYPNANPDSPVQSVTAIGEAGQELIAMAQNILEQGLELEATKLDDNITNVKDYGLSILLKDQFSLRNPQGVIRPRMRRLNINCKDYAGEFFSDLIHKIGDPKLQDYLADCVLSQGILLLIDGTTHRKDGEYANGIDKFLKALDQNDLGGQKRRIAFTISKCEQSQLWGSRYDPKDLAKRRFPLLQKKLENWSNIELGEVDYFANSAFGVLGKNFPEPNATVLSRGRDGTTSIIQYPRLWRPFGLVSPIYWLCTGQRHQELDKD